MEITVVQGKTKALVGLGLAKALYAMRSMLDARSKWLDASWCLYGWRRHCQLSSAVVADSARLYGVLSI